MGLGGIVVDGSNLYYYIENGLARYGKREPIMPFLNLERLLLRLGFCDVVTWFGATIASRLQRKESAILTRCVQEGRFQLLVHRSLDPDLLRLVHDYELYKEYYILSRGRFREGDPPEEFLQRLISYQVINGKIQFIPHENDGTFTFTGKRYTLYDPFSPKRKIGHDVR